jgi:hypothetical protein
MQIDYNDRDKNETFEIIEEAYSLDKQDQGTKSGSSKRSFYDNIEEFKSSSNSSQEKKFRNLTVLSMTTVIIATILIALEPLIFLIIKSTIGFLPALISLCVSVGIVALAASLATACLFCLAAKSGCALEHLQRPEKSVTCKNYEKEGKDNIENLEKTNKKAQPEINRTKDGTFILRFSPEGQIRCGL